MTMTSPVAPRFAARPLDRRINRPEAKVHAQDLRLLAIVASGIPLNAVAGRMGVSDRTVRRRMRRVCELIEVGTPIEAVAWAARRRLI